MSKEGFTPLSANNHSPTAKGSTGKPPTGKQPTGKQEKSSLTEKATRALAGLGSLFHHPPSPAVVNATENDEKTTAEVTKSIDHMVEEWKAKGYDDSRIELEKLKITVSLLQGSVSDLYDCCGKVKDKKKKFKLKLGSELLESIVEEGLGAILESNAVPGFKPAVTLARAAVSSYSRSQDSRMSFEEKVEKLKEKLESIRFHQEEKPIYTLSATQKTLIDTLLNKTENAKKEKTSITMDDIIDFKRKITTTDPEHHSQGILTTRGIIIGWLTPFKNGGSRTRKNKNRRRNRKTRSR